MGVGDADLFKYFEHSVEFLGETADHMWQLVKSDGLCFYFYFGFEVRLKF